MVSWSKEIFARNLKRYMERKGISQKELADIIGVSAPAFNDWIKGRKYPRIDKIELIANYFGIQKSDLIEDKDNITPSPASDSEIKFALFGGDSPEITDEMYEDVKRYAQFIKEKYKK